MAKAVKRIKFKKDTGRPEGSPNVKSGHLRNVPISMRGTEGLEKTFAALIRLKLYKNKVDIIHDAVHQLAIRKLSTKQDLYWVNKIQ